MQSADLHGRAAILAITGNEVLKKVRLRRDSNPACLPNIEEEQCLVNNWFIANQPLSSDNSIN